MGAGGLTLQMPVPSTEKVYGGLNRFTYFTNKSYLNVHYIALAIHIQGKDKE